MELPVERWSERFDFADEDDYQMVIFARGERKARAMYDAVRNRLDMMPRGWRGNEIETFRMWGNPEEIREVCMRGEEGIAAYVPDYGFFILPMPKELW